MRHNQKDHSADDRTADFAVDWEFGARSCYFQTTCFQTKASSSQNPPGQSCRILREWNQPQSQQKAVLKGDTGHLSCWSYRAGTCCIKISDYPYSYSWLKFHFMDWWNLKGVIGHFQRHRTWPLTEKWWATGEYYAESNLSKSINLHMDLLNLDFVSCCVSSSHSSTGLTLGNLQGPGCLEYSIIKAY